MSLARQVEELVGRGEGSRGAGPDVARLLTLLRRLQDQGLIRKPGYDLPLRDTIGRRLVRSGATREGL